MQVVRVSTEKFQFVAHHSKLGVSFLLSASDSWLSDSSKNCYYIWFISIIELMFLSNYGLHIFHQGVFRKYFLLLPRRSWLKSFFSRVLHRNFCSPENPTSAYRKNSDQNSSACYAVNIVFISSCKVSVEKFTLANENWSGNSMVFDTCTYLFSCKFTKNWYFSFLSKLKLSP